MSTIKNPAYQSQWWGYKDQKGKVMFKKFNCFDDIHDLWASGIPMQSTGPIKAKNITEAKKMIKSKLRNCYV